MLIKDCNNELNSYPVHCKTFSNASHMSLFYEKHKQTYGRDSMAMSVSAWELEAVVNTLGRTTERNVQLK